MSGDINQPIAADDRVANVPVAPVPHRLFIETWVTRAAFAICIAIFAGLTWKNDNQNWETLARFGFRSPEAIWHGAISGLVTSAFVHIDVVHLLCNLYWLWILGCCMEKEVGSQRYLLFFVVAAFVSSAYQLAVSDTTGIGLSGVIYAIFGFMWVARGRYPAFMAVLNRKTIQLFLAWLMICVIITRLQILPIGNAAHFTGLLFGMGIAGAFVIRRLSRLTLAGVIALVGFSIVPLFWCPWSATWLSVQAYDAHMAKHYNEALAWYSKVLAINPKNTWALLNRSGVYTALRRIKDARADFEMAREIDPTSVSEQEEQ